jgi:hypothetical protein
MKTEPISTTGLLVRIVIGLLLVLLTYNPTGKSFYHWAMTDFASFDAIKGFAGALLLTGWVFAIRTTLVSMGTLGIALLALVLGTLVWLLVDVGALAQGTPGLLTWVALVVIGVILGVGLSWSAVRQRLTGQVEAN